MNDKTLLGVRKTKPLYLI